MFQHSQLRQVAFAAITCIAVPLCGPTSLFGLEYQEFKKLCQEGIQQKTMTAMEVEIHIGKDTISSNIGIVMLPAFQEPQNWISVLRHTQIGIESLRTFADQLDRRKLFWTPHLQRADRIVAKALARAQNADLSPEQQLTIAMEANRAAADVFSSALHNYAEATGRKYVAPKAMGPIIEFKVETNPSGLTVEILSVGDYIILSQLYSQEEIDNSPLWMELPSGDLAFAYGIFYYRFRKDGQIIPPAFSKERVKNITSQQDAVLFE